MKLANLENGKPELFHFFFLQLFVPSWRPGLVLSIWEKSASPWTDPQLFGRCQIWFTFQAHLPKLHVPVEYIFNFLPSHKVWASRYTQSWNTVLKHDCLPGTTMIFYILKKNMQEKLKQRLKNLEVLKQSAQKLPRMNIISLNIFQLRMSQKEWAFVTCHFKKMKASKELEFPTIWLSLYNTFMDWNCHSVSHFLILVFSLQAREGFRKELR